MTFVADRVQLLLEQQADFWYGNAFWLFGETLLLLVMSAFVVVHDYLASADIEEVHRKGGPVFCASLCLFKVSALRRPETQVTWHIEL